MDDPRTAPGESYEDGRDDFLRDNGWEYVGSNLWRMEGGTGTGVPTNDAVWMTRRRIELRKNV